MSDSFTLLRLLEADIGEPVTSYYEYALIRDRMARSAALLSISRTPWSSQGRRRAIRARA